MSELSEAGLSDEDIDALQGEYDCAPWPCEHCDPRVHDFARAIEAEVLRRASLSPAPESASPAVQPVTRLPAAADVRVEGHIPHPVVVCHFVADYEAQVFADLVNANPTMNLYAAPSPEAASPAPTADANNDRAYLSGAQFGFHLGLTNDTAGLAKLEKLFAPSPNASQQAAPAPALPAVLFDGVRVLNALTEQEHQRAGGWLGIVHVLDAVARLARADLAAPQAAPVDPAPARGAEPPNHRSKTPELLTNTGASPVNTGSGQAVQAVPDERRWREALTLAREYVVNASQRMYDGTNGHGIRQEALRRLALLDAALSTPEAVAQTEQQPGTASPTGEKT